MRTTASIGLSFLLVLSAGACTSGSSGDDAVERGARLTIVGDESLRLENGWATELTVRYTDLDGEPLSGDIEFTLDGEVGGAFLDEVIAQTDAEGRATITLTTGTAGNAAFAVVAEAADADAVEWDVEVLEKVMDVAGMYRLHSQFDLASGIPGAAGTVVNTFIDMTDDPYDPATWMLDKIVEAIDNGTVEDFINSARPALDAMLKTLLVELSPDIVGQLIQVGDAFGQVAQKFGTASTLQVTAGNDVDGLVAAQHILTDLVFAIDGGEYTYAMEDLGMADLTATTEFHYDATRFTLGAHDFPLSYGSILMVALEQLIIPLVDSSASDLTSLLVNLIDCQAVGDAIADYIGFGTSGMYEDGCVFGLGAAAEYIEDQIRSLDSTAMVLGIHGSVRWIDSNDDYKVDVLQGGTWEGQMTYGSAPAPLGPSTFTGERMAQP